MPAAESPARVPPACQRCKLRKVRCDRAAPKCGGCSKAAKTCIIVDPVTSIQYSRDEISQLEQREKELRQRASGAPPVQAAAGDRAVVDGPTPSTASPSDSSAFVGDASGHNLLRFILSDSRWRSCEPQLLRQLAERPQVPELAVKPNKQPLVDEALGLLDTYFDRFHRNHTFLMRRDVMETFNRVYHPEVNQSASSQDYFRLFMIFALSAVPRFRTGACEDHPFGYFLAAQGYLGGVPLIGSMDAIQNLLLIARFGMYHHIGTSIWDLSRFCMRQCIEHNMHLPPQWPMSPLDEQYRSRIFWDCYILDRYSSSVLGRPFAISDRDIAIDLPVNASDAAIEEAVDKTRLSDLAAPPPTAPTELSVFICVIQLRRITSRIYSDFYNGRGVGSASGDTTPSQNLSSGDVYVRLYKFLNELETWRSQAPVFSHPTSLYQRPEWYDFLLAKDKLLLVRSAMYIAPKRNGQPPLDLLTMSLDCATATIELYDKMAHNNWISWTRTYFQIIFTAGLSVFYWISMRAQRQDGHSGSSIASLESTLRLCCKTLQDFRNQMPDAGRFSIVFEMLTNNFLRHFSSGAGTSTQQLELPPAPIFGRPEPQNTVPELQTSDIPSHDPSFQLNSDHASNLEILDMLSASAPDMGQQHGVDQLQAEHQVWPELTDEFMELLENGLGEYAWGTADSNAFPWTDSQFSFEG
ncbi:hypothetical protein V2G26_013245 [Clonostachys chloroleuca]